MLTSDVVESRRREIYDASRKEGMMTLRVWFLSIVAICFLGVASWAQEQNANPGGLETAGSSTSQNGNQQQQNANQNGNQNPNANANEETKPQAPRYLTFTQEANPGLNSGKSGKTYSVDFKSVPVGAEILVDGYFLGRTPNTVQLPAGKYIFTVRKWGYREWNQEIVVSANAPLSVSPQLKEDW
jgi:PEGA domain